jgi:hypothetical protein
MDQLKGKPLKIALAFGVGLACLIGYFVHAVVTAPSDEEALKISISALNRPELKIAFALHPEYCTIRREGGTFGWSVSCAGVPLHFYRDQTLCDPGPPRQCGPMPASYEDCVTYEWLVDLKGNPTSPLQPGYRQSMSISDNCRARGNIVDERSRMREMGIAPVTETVDDYAGKYTGQPRPIPR